jgi:hypothetical protein
MIAGLSFVLLVTVKNPVAWTDLVLWIPAGYVGVMAAGPSVLAAYGIWATRRSVAASMTTCLLAVPVVYYCGFEFTSECIEISHRLRDGIPLKETGGFRLIEWGMIFACYGYLPAVCAAIMGGAYQEISSKGASSNSRKAPRPKSENQPAPALARATGPLNLPRYNA